MRRVDIKGMRDKHGMSQSQFANAIGVTDRTVRRWEAGIIDPSPMALKHIRNFEDEKRKNAEDGKDETPVSSSPRRRVVHLPGDTKGEKRLAPLAAVLPSMGRS